MKALLLATFFACLCTLDAGANEQIDLCEVGLVESHFDEASRPLSGPLESCRAGDTVHFQVNASSASYGKLVARFCDLRDSVTVEIYHSTVHVVCSYLWKWKRDASRTIHPDYRK